MSQCQRRQCVLEVEKTQENCLTYCDAKVAERSSGLYMTLSVRMQ